MNHTAGLDLYLKYEHPELKMDVRHERERGVSFLHLFHRNSGRGLSFAFDTHDCPKHLFVSMMKRALKEIYPSA